MPNPTKLELLAKDFADRWTEPGGLSDDGKLALAHAYETGFKKAREQAAGFVEHFSNPSTRNLALLIRVIGDAREET